MGFYFDGKQVENEEKLEGTMKPTQMHYYAKKFAAHAQRIAERRGYGIGEVGYYINEDCATLVECDIATPGEAHTIAAEAEELLWKADDLGATLNDHYSSYMEEKGRLIATPEELEAEKKRQAEEE